MKIKCLNIIIVSQLPIVSLSSTLTSCSKSFLDYSDNNNYVFIKTIDNAKYDLIFFVGTSNNIAKQENGVAFNHSEMKTFGLSTYNSVGSQLTDKNSSNVFVPLYRQMALNYCLDNCINHEDLINHMIAKEPYQDLKSYLDYYFSKVNKDAKRPFIIAGHSQGAAAVQVVLDKYFVNGGHKSYLKNMVAAYSIGYGVSKKWFDNLDKKLDGNDVLHFAAKADDTNCLISWNTEGPGEKSKSFLLAEEGDKTLVINPLNWSTTDATKISNNKGVLLKKTSNTIQAYNTIMTEGYYISENGESGEKGTRSLMDAQLDLSRGSIICTTNQGYSKIEAYPSLWGGKSLHLYDGSGYYVNMAENIQVRINKFIGKHNYENK